MSGGMYERHLVFYSALEKTRKHQHGIKCAVAVGKRAITDTVIIKGCTYLKPRHSTPKNRCGNSKGKLGIHCAIALVSGTSCRGFCCGYAIVVVNVMAVLKRNTHTGLYHKWPCSKRFANAGRGLIPIESA